MSKKRRITSQNYYMPYRPLLLKWVNALAGIWPGRSALTDLTMESLLSAASKAEKGTDFGDDVFLKPFGILLDAIESEARLNAFGRFATRQRLVSVLRNRIRVQRLVQRYPEILTVQLPPIVMITGLQRTGTTLLHRLLSADDDTRSLLSYEAINPAPFFDDRVKDKKKRVKIAVQSQKALSFIAPDFFAIHPVEAMAQEEDVLLLDYAFISTVPESILNVPSYAAWVEANDNQPAYDYMKLLLKILVWLRPGRRLVLKTPHHLEFLDLFFKTFPGAKIVQTHRNPLETLPSFCSMMCHSRGVFSDRVDAQEVGAHWLKKTARMLNCGLAARLSLKPGQILDIRYSKLVCSPLETIEKIYSATQVALTNQMRQKLIAALRENVHQRYGIHKYNLDSFGLTPQTIQNAYGDYWNQFEPYWS